MVHQSCPACRSISQSECCDRFLAEPALFKIRQSLVALGAEIIVEESGGLGIYAVIFVVIDLRTAASSLRQLYAVLSSKLFYSLHEWQLVVFLHESYDIPGLSAAKAVIELLALIHAERRSLFIVERAKSHVI